MVGPWSVMMEIHHEISPRRKASSDGFVAFLLKRCEHGRQFERLRLHGHRFYEFLARP
jgi:hypothetical protein